MDKDLRKVEHRIVVLPDHLVEGMKLGRNICIVNAEILPDGDIRKLTCLYRNQRTLNGCRANYQLGNHVVTGCPPRNYVDSTGDPLIFGYNYSTLNKKMNIRILVTNG